MLTVVAYEYLPTAPSNIATDHCSIRDCASETGTRQERHVCALYYARSAGFEVIHGLLDRLLLMLGVERREASSSTANAAASAAAGDEAASKKKQSARYFLEAYDGAGFGC